MIKEREEMKERRKCYGELHKMKKNERYKKEKGQKKKRSLKPRISNKIREKKAELQTAQIHEEAPRLQCRDHIMDYKSQKSPTICKSARRHDYHSLRTSLLT